MRPELSKAHLNEEDRDLTYEKSVQITTAYCVFSKFWQCKSWSYKEKTQVPNTMDRPKERMKLLKIVEGPE